MHRKQLHPRRQRECYPQHQHQHYYQHQSQSHQVDVDCRNYSTILQSLIAVTLLASTMIVYNQVDAFQSTITTSLFPVRRSVIVSQSRKTDHRSNRNYLIPSSSSSSIQRRPAHIRDEQSTIKDGPVLDDNENMIIYTRNDISTKTSSSRFLAGLSIGSRTTSYYKRSVVGTDGGRPQVTALDMVVCNSNSDGEAVKQLDKNDFEIHVGRALDTLRKDYPKILQSDPDYSIYDPQMDFIDPSGIKVHGLRSYKRAFRLLHAIIMIVACPSKSGIEMRMCYDQARQNIRIHWNAYIVLRDIFGGATKTNYVDGISVYDLDRVSGNITEHRIERLLINDIPLIHEQGIIAALQEKHAVVLPNFSEQLQPSKTHQAHENDESLILATAGGSPNTVVQFQQTNLLLHTLFQFGGKRDHVPSSLFALEATNEGDGSAAMGSSSSSSSSSNNNNNNHNHNKGGASGDIEAAHAAALQARFPALDWNAYDRKNKSRQKFGLKPLSPEEFLDIESKVYQLAKMQEEKIAEQQLLQQQLKQEEDANAGNKKKNKVGEMFGKLFSTVLQDTCETNYDCERPEICCDFGFQKRCCFSGSPVGRADWSQMIPIRVAADVDNYPGLGRGGGGGGDQRNY